MRLHQAIKTAKPHSLVILDHSGDTTVTWDETDYTTAKELFDRAMAAGKVAYKVDTDGESHEIVRSFQPEAQTIVISAPLVGG